VKLLACWLGLFASALAENPYLAHQDDAPVTRQFSGKEWGDDAGVPVGKESIPFRANVATQRVAAMPWGAIYKISFESSSKREISPLHFLVTDGEILLLASEDMEREIRVIREMARQPKFEKSDVWALTKGSLKLSDPPWSTTVSVRGDACLRQAFHENSGHFSRIAWKRGIGLVEFAQGRGAMQDGFELKWQAAGKKSR
jgi:hypothetical protein